MLLTLDLPGYLQQTAPGGKFIYNQQWKFGFGECFNISQVSEASDGMKARRDNRK